MKDILGGDQRMGLTRIRRHLGYGRGYGWGLWAPWWVLHAIAATWNWISCHTLGHDTMGPWQWDDEEDGKNIHIPGFRRGYYPRTCTACGKRWAERDRMKGTA